MERDPICVFGGAFDPIHIGHLIVAEDVREKRGFRSMLFMPCNIPPTKERTRAGAEDRIEMVRLCAGSDSAFEVSDTELNRGGVSYTVETLEELRSLYGPHRAMFLLVGMDQLNAIESWRRPEDVARLCTILAVHRPGFEPAPVPEKYSGRVELVDARPVGVSSSEIRERVSRGMSIRYLVTEAVEQYIHARGLYGAKDAHEA